MKVTIYGPGCARCEKAADLVRQVLAERGIPAEFEKITDYAAIAKAGVLATPGISLDGKIVSTGQLPSTAEIAHWVEGAQ